MKSDTIIQVFDRFNSGSLLLLFVGINSVLIVAGESLKLSHAQALQNGSDESFEQIHPYDVSITAGKLEVEPTSTISSKKETPNEELCVTHGCIKAAVSVLDSIDDSVDPCDNFFKFACGTYIKNTFIPDDRVTIDSFSVVRDKVQDQLREIINEAEQPNESKPFLLAKRLNKACLNKTIIEQRGIKPLADILESYGGWPVVKGDLWSEDSFNWLDMIKRFRQAGLDTSIIFSFAVVTNLKNSTSRVLDVSCWHWSLCFNGAVAFKTFIHFSDRYNGPRFSPRISDQRIGGEECESVL